MKKQIYLLTAILMALTSCDRLDFTQSDPATNKQTKTVQFVMQGITEEFSTRATVESAGCTDLWIWEGTTLLAHKVSTDEDFSTPTVNLTYGAHDLTFLASLSVDQSWDNGVWSCTKVGGDYAKQMSVTVSANSSNSRQVQLTRRSSRVKFETTDNVPSNITQCKISVQTCLSLSADLTGSNSTSRNATVDITNKQGSTYSLFINVLTESPTDAEDCSATIQFLDASNTVKYEYTRNVSVKPNRCVTLKGNYFLAQDANAISIVSTEWENITQNLF